MPSVVKRASPVLLDLQRVVLDARPTSDDDKQRRRMQSEHAVKLNALRLGNLFCDVQLQFGRGSHRRLQLSSHKVLLTVASDYFLELFCGMPKLQNVHFPHLDAAVCDLMLSYVYFSRVELTVSLAARFLRVVSLLRFDPDCIERCAAFLRDNLALDNVLEVRQQLPANDLSAPVAELRTRANNYIRAHVGELIEHALAHASSSASTPLSKTPSCAVAENAGQPISDESPRQLAPGSTGESEPPTPTSNLAVVKLRLALSNVEQLCGAQNGPEGAKVNAYRELAGLVLRWLSDYAMVNSRNWPRLLTEDCVFKLALDEANRLSLTDPVTSKLAVSPSGQWTCSSFTSMCNLDADSDVESVQGQTASGAEGESEGPVQTRGSHKNSCTDSALENSSVRPSSSSRGSLGMLNACELNEYESPLGDCSSSLLETCVIAVHVQNDRPDRFACITLLQSKLVLLSVYVDLPKEPVELDEEDPAETALSCRTRHGTASSSNACCNGNGNGNGNINGNGIAHESNGDTQSVSTCEESIRTARRHSSSSGSISPTRASNSATNGSNGTHRRALTLEPLADMLEARCGHACVPLDDRLLVLGGYNRDRCLSTVELYQLAGNCWSPLGTMKSARARFGACLVGDYLLACGGSDGSADLHSCELLNISSLLQRNVDGNANPTQLLAEDSHLRFQPVESMNYVRSSHAVATLDEQAYAVGGNAGNTDLNVMELYDLGKDEWIVGPSLRSERSQPAVCADVHRSCLYAVGGSRQGSALGSLERYDPREPAWHLLDCRLTAPRRGAAAVCCSDGLVYVVGGHSGAQTLRAADVFDPRNLSVQSIGSLNVARTNLACCALYASEASEPLIVALGGFSGKQFLGSLEFYDTQADRWALYKPAGCDRSSPPPTASACKPLFDPLANAALNLSVSSDADLCDFHLTSD